MEKISEKKCDIVKKLILEQRRRKMKLINKVKHLVIEVRLTQKKNKNDFNELAFLRNSQNHFRSDQIQIFA